MTEPGVTVEYSTPERVKRAYLKREYTYGWAAIAVAWFVSVVYQIPWLVRLSFYAGWILEFVAILRRKHGDTFSEHLVKFRDGKWARDILVGGTILGVSGTFVWIGDGPLLWRVVVALAFLAWFSVHIYTDLREG